MEIAQIYINSKTDNKLLPNLTMEYCRALKMNDNIMNFAKTSF